MWLNHMEARKSPQARFFLPGPGDYNFNISYMKDCPSKGANTFSRAERPLNKISMQI